MPDWGWLGNIKFRLGHSPSSFSRSVAHVYSQHERIEGKPLLQNIGDELEEIKIDIQLHENFCDPTTALRKIEELAYSHKPESLVLGDGRYFGNLVIESFEETLLVTHANGHARVIELSISLIEADKWSIVFKETGNSVIA